MSGLVGVFAVGGSRIPCEPKIAAMAALVAQDTDVPLSFSDHRLRLEALLNPTLQESSFRCEDTGCLVWLNGQFHNTPKLVSRLGSDGAKINNAAELLLQLYQVKGLLAVPMLRGSFAAVIWDPNEQRLLLFRDPVGLKSLYVHQDGDHLWFASSERALAQLEMPSLEPKAFNSLLMSGSLGAGHTLLRKVRCIKPGEIILAERGQVRQTCYWQFLQEQSVVARTHQDCAKALCDSVDRILAQSGKQTVQILDGEGVSSQILRRLFERRSPYAIQTQTETIVTSRPPSLTELVRFWGQPFGDFNAYHWAKTLINKQEGNFLVLPLGEDILFGYHQVFQAQRWQQRQNCDSAAYDQFASMRSYINQRAVTKTLFADDFIESLELEGLALEQEIPPEWQTWSGLEQAQAGLFRWHLQPMLGPLARIANQHRLTFAMPFLDLDVIDVISELNTEQHRTGVIGGQYLAAAFTDLLGPAEHNDSRFNTDFKSLAKGPQQHWASLWPECCQVLEAAALSTLPLKHELVQRLLQDCRLTNGVIADWQKRALLLAASFTLWWQMVFASFK